MSRLKRRKLFIWITHRAMTRILIASALLILLFTLFTYDYSSTRTWTHWTMPLSGQTIVIDAGHGGVDGGAESNSGLVEKHITLDIALAVRDYLQQSGALVIMTREDDRDLAQSGTKGLSRRKTQDLLKRAEVIREAKPDLFVTIHLNSVPSSRWRGAQTFYYPGREEDQRLATFIQEEMKRNLENTDRLANTVSTIYLLKSAQIPSALVEVGFLSNPEEARLLGDDRYQAKLAASIYRGILRFCSGEPLPASS